MCEKFILCFEMYEKEDLEFLHRPEYIIEGDSRLEHVKPNDEQDSELLEDMKNWPML
ncbi:hypothetical protein JCM31598_24510 [Desulfonatronum parangueonense]